MLAGSLLLGGLLPLSPSSRDRWAPSGAWRLPVGDPYELTVERPAEPGPFFLLRGVEWDGGRASHQGADIGCGASGGFVRASAAGIVVRAADHGEFGGYGTHVVLAHRLPGGVLAYSVYAHLRTASLRVRAGQVVTTGTILGRVGMTGRATTPHLHFEIRTTSDPGERWELASVEDPLAFVEERLPSHRGDTSGVAAYLEWAEFASLLPTDAQGDDALSRERWWRMLAVVGRGTLLDPGLPAEELRDSLIEAGILARSAADRSAGHTMDWPELARDVSQLRDTPPRGGTAPLRRARHREVCEAHLGSPTPSKRASELSGRPGKPSLTEAVLLIADLAGPAPEPAKKKPTPVAKKAGATRPDSLASPSRARTASDSAAKVRPATPRYDSVMRSKRPTAKPDTGVKAKPKPAKPDTAARLSSAPAKPKAAVKAKPKAVKPDSAAKVTTRPAAKPDSAVKAKPKPVRSDSAAKATRPAAKPDSAVKATPKAVKPDSAAKVSRPAAKSGSAVKPKPKPAKPPAPSRPDTSAS